MQACEKLCVRTTCHQSFLPLFQLSDQLVISIPGNGSMTHDYADRFCRLKNFIEKASGRKSIIRYVTPDRWMHAVVRTKRRYSALW